MECYLAIKNNELFWHITTWVDIKNLLTEKSYMQKKNTYYLILCKVQEQVKLIYGARSRKVVASMERIDWKRIQGTFWDGENIQYFI